MFTVINKLLKLIGSKMKEKDFFEGAMKNLITNNMINDNHSDNIDFETQGFRDAAKVGGVVSAYRNSIEHVYCNFISQESLKKDKTKEKNFEIEQKIEELNGKLSLKKKELDELNNKDLPEAQRELEKASKDLLDFYKNPLNFIREEKDLFLQWVYGVVAFTLMVFLYFFYTSVIYSALFRDVTISKFTIYNSIFYPRALEEAWHKGIASLMITIFAPFIFYALGIVLENFKRKLGDPKRKIKYFAGLFFAFILDSIFAYHISERIYNSKATNTYDTIEPYSFWNAVGDLNYWIIIALGFCVYILFGVIFYFYNELRTNSSKYEKFKLEFEKIKEEAQLKIKQINEKISLVKDEIKNIESQILEMKKELEKVYYSPIEIKKILTLYTNGWIKFLKHGKFQESQIKEIEDQLNKFYIEKGMLKNE